jgi:hypothetical protein
VFRIPVSIHTRLERTEARVEQLEQAVRRIRKVVRPILLRGRVVQPRALGEAITDLLLMVGLSEAEKLEQRPDDRMMRHSEELTEIALGAAWVIGAN